MIRKINTTAIKYLEEELEESEILPEDIALDLHATAPPVTLGRTFWEDDRYVQLGLASIDCSNFFSRFSDEDKSSFKKHIIIHGDSLTLGGVSLLALVRSFSSTGNDHPPEKLDVSWASKCIENYGFRYNKTKVLQFLEFWNDRYPGVVSDDTLNFLAQAASSRNKSNNVESDDPEKSWLSNEEYADVLQAIWKFYDETGAHQPTLISAVINAVC